MIFYSNYFQGNDFSVLFKIGLSRAIIFVERFKKTNVKYQLWLCLRKQESSTKKIAQDNPILNKTVTSFPLEL